MNTITTFKNQFINQFSLESFHTAILAFRAKAKKEGLSSSEHILYNALRNLPLTRGFTPITNKVKLANGQHENYGFLSAKVNLKYNLKNPQTLEKILKSFSLPKESGEYFMNLLNE